LRVKAALLLLLIFTSITTATATIVVPTTSSRAASHLVDEMTTVGDSLVEPLGDPIDDDPAFPH
jgi:hypothetical protein